MKLQAPLALSLCVVASSVFAQTPQTWNTNVPGANWSTIGNWSPNQDPAGNDLIFGDSFGETANATTVGNVVDQNYTANSLTYNNSGTTGNFWQVTEISSGVTLTLNSSSPTPPGTIFSVGGGVTSASTRAAIRGAGSLVIDEPTSIIAVGVASAGQSAVLDMSGLSSFSANAATVNFGASRGNGDVSLAGTNSITATTLNLGTSVPSTSGSTTSDLLLGTSNTFNIDTINVGLNFASGTVGFRSGLTNPTITIRGSAGGTSRTDLTIANTLATPVTNGQASAVDFTGSGGSVDALIDDLLIGRRGDVGTSSTSAATYAGTLSMNKGVIDASRVTLGQSAGVGVAANTVTGNLNVSGGSFIAGSINMADNDAGATSVVSNLNVSGTAEVKVTGNIVAGSKKGTATTVAANINVSSGTLLIQGNLTEGTDPAGGTSTVNLSGGTLDMDHGVVSVDSFNFTGGILKNVSSFEAGVSGGLNLQNSSTLAFDINSSFTTLNLTGVLSLGGGSNLALTLQNGFLPNSSFTLVANDLIDSISGVFVTINGVAFGAGNTFSLANDQGVFEFQLLYNGGSGNDLLITAVPEPSVCGLLAMGVGAAAFLRRRAQNAV